MPAGVSDVSPAVKQRKVKMTLKCWHNRLARRYDRSRSIIYPRRSEVSSSHGIITCSASGKCSRSAVSVMSAGKLPRYSKRKSVGPETNSMPFISAVSIITDDSTARLSVRHRWLPSQAARTVTWRVVTANQNQAFTRTTYSSVKLTQVQHLHINISPTKTLQFTKNRYKIQRTLVPFLFCVTLFRNYSVTCI